MAATSATAGNAAGTGRAHYPFRPPKDMWQVLWPQVTVTHSYYGSGPVTFYRDEMLPVTYVAAEITQRQTLAQGGALRIIRAVTSATDHAALITAAGTAEATAETTGILAGSDEPSTAARKATVVAGGTRFLTL